MTTAAPTLQRPSIMLVPEHSSSAGAEAVELAAMAGLVLDDWQVLVLEHALAEREDGKWAAFEIGLNVARQNGKGSILEARELAGLFLIGERLITHSAHQFDTSLEAFRRLLFLIEWTPELSRRVKRVSKSHGEEGIELHARDGMPAQRIRFRTRTQGGGRGFTGDLLVLDEAMILRETSIGALMPTLSARPNPQVFYAGSAVDQTVHEHGVVWARVRERAIERTDARLAYFEWSFDPRAEGDESKVNPMQVTESMARSADAWAAANPAMGIRIDPEHIEAERRSMDPRTFAVERLGVGDWPETDTNSSVIDGERWDSLADPDSTITGPVYLVFDVTPDRAYASIGAAGRREDGLVHVEVIDHRRGTGWVAKRLAELQERHGPAAVSCDVSSPAKALVKAVEAEGVSVTEVSAGEYVDSCGSFFDLVEDGRLRHLGSGGLNAAVRGAVTRPRVDAWAWSRKSSKVDITPLVCVTIAAAQADQTADPGFSWED